MRLIYFVSLSLLAFISSNSHAFEWGASSVSYLKGSKYQTPYFNLASNKLEGKDTDAEIFTFDHVNGTKWGDTFFALDATNFSTEKQSLWFKFAPRVSGKKTLGLSYPSFISDILMSGVYSAVGAGAAPNYAYGAAIDWIIPGFDFFTTNFLVRDDKKLEGTTSQISLVWNLTFKLGASENLKIETGGFLDYMGEEGNQQKGLSKANIQTQPFIALKIQNNVSVGVEWQYWSNKYGLEGINESLPQMMVKMHL